MKRLALLTGLLALCFDAHANTCVPLQAGATDQSVYVKFIDESTGIPNSSLVFNSSGIDLEYVRNGAAAVDITEVTQTAAGAHTDGGFVSVGHGQYRLDLPDAAVATGVPQVVIQGTITGYIMLPCAVALSPPANVVRFGGTDGTFTSGRPNVNASHIGGTSQTGRDIGASVLISSGTGTGQLSVTSGVIASSVQSVANNAITASAIASNAIDADAVATDAVTEIQSGLATSSALTAVDTVVDTIQVTTDKLDDTLELDSTVYRFTANALEQAPTGSGGSVDDGDLGIVASGTAQAGTATTIQLADATSLADDMINCATILITGGTGAGQARTITDWVSSTDTATVATWTTNPSSDSTYNVFGTACGSLGDGSTLTAIPWNSAWDAEVESEVDDALGGGTGTALTSIPWNSAWDAEVQSEATDALNAYDPPTNAELTARTLASASYATATALQTVDDNVDAILVDTSTTLDDLVDDLETRLTATRAGYLDNLSAGAVATASALATVDGVVDTIQVTTDKLDDTLELDSTVYRFTANALEQAPTGSGESLSAIADAVWDELLSGHTTEGSAGEALANASSAGDPWSTSLPGAYGSGTAGNIIGNMLDAAVSTRASQSSLDTVDGNVDSVLEDTGTTLPAAIGALNDLDSSDVQTAAAAALTAYDPPTNTEMEARTLASASYATASALATVDSNVDAILVDTAEIGAAGAGLTAIPSVGSVDDLEQIALADAAVVNCEVNTANFAGSSTTVACILTDRDGGAITAASNDLEGKELLILSGAQIYEGRFINDSTWDGANSELRLTLSRALPGTLADAVTAIIR